MNVTCLLMVLGTVALVLVSGCQSFVSSEKASTEELAAGVDELDAALAAEAVGEAEATAEIADEVIERGDELDRLAEEIEGLEAGE